MARSVLHRDSRREVKEKDRASEEAGEAVGGAGGTGHKSPVFDEAKYDVMFGLKVRIALSRIAWKVLLILGLTCVIIRTRYTFSPTHGISPPQVKSLERRSWPFACSSVEGPSWLAMPSLRWSSSSLEIAP
jgi:hypothetical protein